jgi:hypothetical protein
MKPGGVQISLRMFGFIHRAPAGCIHPEVRDPQQALDRTLGNGNILNVRKRYGHLTDG